MYNIQFKSLNIQYILQTQITIHFSNNQINYQEEYTDSQQQSSSSTSENYDLEIMQDPQILIVESITEANQNEKVQELQHYQPVSYQFLHQVFSTLQNNLSIFTLNFLVENKYVRYDIDLLKLNFKIQYNDQSDFYNFIEPLLTIEEGMNNFIDNHFLNILQNINMLQLQRYLKLIYLNDQFIQKTYQLLQDSLDNLSFQSQTIYMINQMFIDQKITLTPKIQSYLIQIQSLQVIEILTNHTSYHKLLKQAITTNKTLFIQNLIQLTYQQKQIAAFSSLIKFSQSLLSFLQLKFTRKEKREIFSFTAKNADYIVGNFIFLLSHENQSMSNLKILQLVQFFGSIKLFQGFTTVLKFVVKKDELLYYFVSTSDNDMFNCYNDVNNSDNDSDKDTNNEEDSTTTDNDKITNGGDFTFQNVLQSLILDCIQFDDIGSGKIPLPIAIQDNVTATNSELVSTNENDADTTTVNNVDNNNDNNNEEQNNKDTQVENQQDQVQQKQQDQQQQNQQQEQQWQQQQQPQQQQRKILKIINQPTDEDTDKFLQTALYHMLQLNILKYPHNFQIVIKLLQQFQKRNLDINEENYKAILILYNMWQQQEQFLYVDLDTQLQCIYNCRQKFNIQLAKPKDIITSHSLFEILKTLKMSEGISTLQLQYLVCNSQVLSQQKKQQFLLIFIDTFCDVLRTHDYQTIMIILQLVFNSVGQKQQLNYFNKEYFSSFILNISHQEIIDNDYKLKLQSTVEQCGVILQLLVQQYFQYEIDTYLQENNLTLDIQENYSQIYYQLLVKQPFIAVCENIVFNKQFIPDAQIKLQRDQYNDLIAQINHLAHKLNITIDINKWLNDTNNEIGIDIQKEKIVVDETQRYKLQYKSIPGITIKLHETYNIGNEVKVKISSYNYAWQTLQQYQYLKNKYLRYYNILTQASKEEYNQQIKNITKLIQQIIQQFLDDIIKFKDYVQQNPKYLYILIQLDIIQHQYTHSYMLTRIYYIQAEKYKGTKYEKTLGQQDYLSQILSPYQEQEETIFDLEYSWLIKQIIHQIEQLFLHRNYTTLSKDLICKYFIKFTKLQFDDSLDVLNVQYKNIQSFALVLNSMHYYDSLESKLNVMKMFNLFLKDNQQYFIQDETLSKIERDILYQIRISSNQQPKQPQNVQLDDLVIYQNILAFGKVLEPNPFKNYIIKTLTNKDKLNLLLQDKNFYNINPVQLFYQHSLQPNYDIMNSYQKHKFHNIITKEVESHLQYSIYNYFTNKLLNRFPSIQIENYQVVNAILQVVTQICTLLKQFHDLYNENDKQITDYQAQLITKINEIINLYFSIISCQYLQNDGVTALIILFSQKWFNQFLLQFIQSIRRFFTNQWNYKSAQQILILQYRFYIYVSKMGMKIIQHLSLKAQIFNVAFKYIELTNFQDLLQIEDYNEQKQKQQEQQQVFYSNIHIHQPQVQKQVNKISLEQFLTQLQANITNTLTQVFLNNQYIISTEQYIRYRIQSNQIKGANIQEELMNIYTLLDSNVLSYKDCEQYYQTIIRYAKEHVSYEIKQQSSKSKKDKEKRTCFLLYSTIKSMLQKNIILSQNPCRQIYKIILFQQDRKNKQDLYDIVEQDVINNQNIYYYVVRKFIQKTIQNDYILDTKQAQLRCALIGQLISICQNITCATIYQQQFVSICMQELTFLQSDIIISSQQILGIYQNNLPDYQQVLKQTNIKHILQQNIYQCKFYLTNTYNMFLQDHETILKLAKQKLENFSIQYSQIWNYDQFIMEYDYIRGNILQSCKFLQNAQLNQQIIDLILQQIGILDGQIYRLRNVSQYQQKKIMDYVTFMIVTSLLIIFNLCMYYLSEQLSASKYAENTKLQESFVNLKNAKQDRQKLIDQVNELQQQNQSMQIKYQNLCQKQLDENQFQDQNNEQYQQLQQEIQQCQQDIEQINIKLKQAHRQQETIIKYCVQQYEQMQRIVEDCIQSHKQLRENQTIVYVTDAYMVTKQILRNTFRISFQREQLQQYTSKIQDGVLQILVQNLIKYKLEKESQQSKLQQQHQLQKQLFYQNFDKIGKFINNSFNQLLYKVNQEKQIQYQEQQLQQKSVKDNQQTSTDSKQKSQNKDSQTQSRQENQSESKQNVSGSSLSKQTQQTTFQSMTIDNNQSSKNEEEEQEIIQQNLRQHIQEIKTKLQLNGQLIQHQQNHLQTTIFGELFQSLIIKQLAVQLYNSLEQNRQYLTVEQVQFVIFRMIENLKFYKQAYNIDSNILITVSCIQPLFNYNILTTIELVQQQERMTLKERVIEKQYQNLDSINFSMDEALIQNYSQNLDKVVQFLYQQFLNAVFILGQYQENELPQLQTIIQELFNKKNITKNIDIVYQDLTKQIQLQDEQIKATLRRFISIISNVCVQFKIQVQQVSLQKVASQTIQQVILTNLTLYVYSCIKYSECSFYQNVLNQKSKEQRQMLLISTMINSLYTLLQTCEIQLYNTSYNIQQIEMLQKLVQQVQGEHQGQQYSNEYLSKFTNTQYQYNNYTRYNKKNFIEYLVICVQHFYQSKNLDQLLKQHYINMQIIKQQYQFINDQSIYEILYTFQSAIQLLTNIKENKIDDVEKAIIKFKYDTVQQNVDQNIINLLIWILKRHTCFIVLKHCGVDNHRILDILFENEYQTVQSFSKYLIRVKNDYQAAKNLTEQYHLNNYISLLPEKERYIYQVKYCLQLSYIKIFGGYLNEAIQLIEEQLKEVENLKQYDENIYVVLKVYLYYARAMIYEIYIEIGMISYSKNSQIMFNQLYQFLKENDQYIANNIYYGMYISFEETLDSYLRQNYSIFEQDNNDKKMVVLRNIIQLQQNDLSCTLNMCSDFSQFVSQEKQLCKQIQLQQEVIYHVFNKILQVLFICPLYLSGINAEITDDMYKEYQVPKYTQQKRFCLYIYIKTLLQRIAFIPKQLIQYWFNYILQISYSYNLCLEQFFVAMEFIQHCIYDTRQPINIKNINYYNNITFYQTHLLLLLLQHHLGENVSLQQMDKIVLHYGDILITFEEFCQLDKIKQFDVVCDYRNQEEIEEDKLRQVIVLSLFYQLFYKEQQNTQFNIKDIYDHLNRQNEIILSNKQYLMCYKTIKQFIPKHFIQENNQYIEYHKFYTTEISDLSKSLYVKNQLNKINIYTLQSRNAVYNDRDIQIWQNLYISSEGKYLTKIIINAKTENQKIQNIYINALIYQQTRKLFDQFTDEYNFEVYKGDKQLVFIFDKQLNCQQFQQQIKFQYINNQQEYCFGKRQISEQQQQNLMQQIAFLTIFLQVFGIGSDLQLKDCFYDECSYIIIPIFMYEMLLPYDQNTIKEYILRKDTFSRTNDYTFMINKYILESLCINNIPEQVSYYIQGRLNQVVLNQTIRLNDIPYSVISYENSNVGINTMSCGFENFFVNFLAQILVYYLSIKNITVQNKQNFRQLIYTCADIMSRQLEQLVSSRDEEVKNRKFMLQNIDGILAAVSRQKNNNVQEPSILKFIKDYVQ